MTATEVIAQAMREHHFLTELQSDGTKHYHCGKCCGDKVCVAHSVEEYRTHVAQHVLDALGLREEYAIVDRSNAGNIAEGHDDADETIEAMDLYWLDGWMAASRLVSDWRNLEST